MAVFLGFLGSLVLLRRLKKCGLASEKHGKSGEGEGDEVAVDAEGAAEAMAHGGLGGHDESERLFWGREMKERMRWVGCYVVD